MSVNHIMKRCIAESHALQHKTPLSTCTPLSKLTRILSGVCWKVLTSKNGYTNLAKCELKKNEVSVRHGALCNAVNFIKHFAD